MSQKYKKEAKQDLWKTITNVIKYLTILSKNLY